MLNDWSRATLHFCPATGLMNRSPTIEVELILDATLYKSSCHSFPRLHNVDVPVQASLCRMWLSHDPQTQTLAVLITRKAACAFFFHTICEACHWALDGSLSLPRFLHLLNCARDSLRGAGESCLKWQEKYVNIRAEDSERKVCVCVLLCARVFTSAVSLVYRLLPADVRKNAYRCTFWVDLICMHNHLHIKQHVVRFLISYILFFYLFIFTSTFDHIFLFLPAD